MTEPGSVMLSEIRETPKILHGIAKLFDNNEDIKNLYKKQNFQSVIILARGTSDNAAHFLKYLIEIKLGLPVGLASPSAATMYSAKFNYSKTLVIALSQSGQSSDLITFAKAAKEGGGFILSITNDSESPLAKLSDLHIPINAGPEIAVPATKSYVGQIFISYLLVLAWANEETDTDQIIKNSQEWCDSINSVAAFCTDLQIKKPIYVLGRGISYPNAKEFALKLQETSLIPVQGMSSSDFLHGPIASLDKESQVIFIAPKLIPKDSFGEAPARVREVTGKVLWIGSSEFATDKDLVLEGGQAKSEIEAAISDALAFQLVTHHIAIKNGLNPDSPRGLNKVTITL